MIVQNQRYSSFIECRMRQLHGFEHPIVQNRRYLLIFEYSMRQLHSRADPIAQNPRHLLISEYAALRNRRSGTFPGRTRNTGQRPVFRRGGGGPEHNTVCCVPVVSRVGAVPPDPKHDRNTGQCPVFRSPPTRTVVIGSGGDRITTGTQDIGSRRTVGKQKSCL